MPFFSYDPLTYDDLLAYFQSTGSTVGVERSGDDYWIWHHLGGNQYWWVKLEWNAGHATHALTYSEIRDGDDNLLENLQDDDNVWEYAVDIVAAGGWVGNYHGRDPEATINFEVDGSPVVLADGESASGTTSVVVTRESDWTSDPGPPDTHIADCTTVYTMRPVTGLDVQITVDWNTPAWPEQTGYMAMWPHHKTHFDRGIITTHPKVFELDLWAGADINNTNVTSNAVCAFKEGSGWGMLLTTLDGRNRATFIQERNNIIKFYCSETASDGVTIGSNYRVKYFDDTEFLENV